MRQAVLALCTLLLVVSRAEAAMITFDPAALLVSPGDSVTLDLVASDLGGAVIGDFDVDIGFDAARLTLTGFSLTSALGDFGLGEAFDFSLGLLVPGLLNVAVVSTLSSADLDALQSGTVVLVSLSFDVDTLAPGATTTVEAIVNALGDGDGAELAVAAPGDATLRAPGGVSVPEPGSLWLLASGLFGSVVMRRRIAVSRQEGFGIAARTWAG